MLLSGVLFALDKSRVIKPIVNEKDAIFTKSLYNVLAPFDTTTQRLTHMAYIAGFLDAVQMEQTNMPEVKNFLSECQGMSLGDLTTAMLKFYQENPQWRETGPSIILTVVIPRLKKGLAPFPSSKENAQ
jgi:hypothetical protein